jgi:tRNA(fMet)-specific endonuclease VapC
LGLLIDTSLFIAIERSGAHPSALLEQLGSRPVAISAITASEILHGVHRADSAVRRGRRERFVEAVLEAIPVLPFNLDVARIHAQLCADLEIRGQTIGANDVIIAATALAHDLTVITGNVRHFKRVAGLRVVVAPPP